MRGPEELAEGIRRVKDADEATRRRWADNAQQLLARFSRTAASQSLQTALDEAVAESPRRLGWWPVLAAVGAGVLARCVVRRGGRG